MKTYHDIATDGGSDVAGQVRAQEARLHSRLADVGHIVAVMSGKGGVGKSAVTVLLATALARSGIRTGIVDADINGASIVEMTGVGRKPDRTSKGVIPAVSAEGVQIMSIDLFLDRGTPVEWNAVTQKSAFTWRAMVEVAAIREMLADTLWGPLDVLFVDLPPGTDRLPNLLDLVPELSVAIVVTIPSRASRYVVEKSILLARPHLGDAPIGIVENMSEFVCNSCGEVHEMFPGSESVDFEQDAHLTILGRIPFDPELSKRIDSGKNYLGSGTSKSSGGVGVFSAEAAIQSIAENLNRLLASRTIPAPTMEEVR